MMQPELIPQFEPRPKGPWPALGCLAVLVALGLMCLMPLLLIEVLQTALLRLHLSPGVAAFAVLAIILGSMINIPVARLPRDEAQPELVMGLVYYGMFAPQFRRARRETVIAVNVGGCVIPVLLAAWEAFQIGRLGVGALAGAAVIALINIFACYRLARPVAGIGILMPAFVAPALAVIGAALVCHLWPGLSPLQSAPVAFLAGVAGPLVGADLLHLRDMRDIPAGIMSIGGAGTFDGILLSAVLAALIA